jgi:hypothetical protein
MLKAATACGSESNQMNEVCSCGVAINKRLENNRNTGASKQTLTLHCGIGHFGVFFSESGGYQRLTSWGQPRRAFQEIHDKWLYQSFPIALGRIRLTIHIQPVHGPPLEYAQMPSNAVQNNDSEWKGMAGAKEYRCGD